jgi:hypothetical protein
VLLISIRETGALPLFLHLWIDAWARRRAGRKGALVALIGMPAQPDIQSDQAYRYLEGVARRAGLDFLPQERKLPEVRLAKSTFPKSTRRSSPRLPGTEDSRAAKPVPACADDRLSKRARQRSRLFGTAARFDHGGRAERAKAIDC